MLYNADIALHTFAHINRDDLRVDDLFYSMLCACGAVPHQLFTKPDVVSPP